MRLSSAEAAALHAALERLLEDGQPDPHLERAYRLLGWRMLAATGGTGLTATIASLAREASTLEDYESARRRPCWTRYSRASNVARTVTREERAGTASPPARSRLALPLSARRCAAFSILVE